MRGPVDAAIRVSGSIAAVSTDRSLSPPAAEQCGLPSHAILIDALAGNAPRVLEAACRIEEYGSLVMMDLSPALLVAECPYGLEPLALSRLSRRTLKTYHGLSNDSMCAGSRSLERISFALNSQSRH